MGTRMGVTLRIRRVQSDTCDSGSVVWQFGVLAAAQEHPDTQCITVVRSMALFSMLFDRGAARGLD